MTLPRLSEYLAGRMEVLTLWPLSQGEIDGRLESFVDAVMAGTLPESRLKPEARSEIIMRILRGGYPEVLSRATETRRAAWHASYVTTILQRDVRDLANIEGLTIMPRLLALLAARGATLTNFAELSRSAAIPLSTLKRYVALLESTFLIYFLPSWSANLGKRIVKAPKIMICDTGLMAHSLGIDAQRLSASADHLGPILENFVVMELQKQVTWSRSQPRMFHFRTHSGEEVDIVLESSGGGIAGVEVKAGSTVGTSDFKGLRRLAEATGKRFQLGIVLYMGSSAIPFGPRLHALPVSALWL
jgi:predicted AAA+ superfamily ATPase